MTYLTSPTDDMTTIMCDRMQNLHISNGPSNNGEPKFYHYCYVCNTQLNSCKQALLHCSGKRHKKKLQFLQSRKHSVPQLPSNSYGAQGSTSGSVPPPPVAPTSNDQGVNFAPPFCPPVPGPPGFGPNMGPYMGEVPPGMVPTVPSQAPPFYPLSPAFVAGTDQWLHPVPPPQSFGNMGSAQFVGDPQYSMVPMIAFGSNLAHVNGQFTASSSPLLPTDISGSSYSGGPRSALISPSETSSMSSDPSGVLAIKPHYKCHVCHRQFINGAQLHNHLQAAKHFKHHSHHFRSQSTESSKKDDSAPETECNIYYCSVCSIAVNSQTQLHSHNAGQKHRIRSTNPQQRSSRSSSTSSERTAGELTLESGYTSGSGDEVIRVVSAASSSSSSTTMFKCQSCNTFFNSTAQATQHLKSPKHIQRQSGSRPPFRRKSNSLRRKPKPQQAPSSPSHDETQSLSDRCETPSSPTEELTETDSTLTVHATQSL